MATTEQATDASLIQRYIDTTTDDRGPEYARLADYGTPVWALIGAWKALEDDSAVASEYAVPIEYVRAARAYYRHRQPYIDAFLLLNELPENVPPLPAA